MSIEPSGPAPYAPPSAFLSFLEAVRERDLPTPYSVEVLMRAGVTEGLAPRVLKTLRLLDLVDDNNEPTPQLHDLAKAGSADYKERLADVIRSGYADVFRYVDPGQDSMEKIQDQFRHYTPRGQRERMVTLFLGLCEFVGLAPTRERETKPRTAKPRPKVSPKPKKQAGTSSQSPAPSPVPEPVPEFTPTPPPSSNGNPFIEGLVAQLPETGTEWPKEKRQAWTDAALAIFDLIYELPSESAKGGGPDS
jgi:hypothetical protein